MSKRQLEDILKKRVIEPFVYDNRNERFIGKRTGKPIVLNNDSDSESPIKIASHSIVVNYNESQNNMQKKRQQNDKVKNQDKQDQIHQQIQNQILSTNKQKKEQNKSQVEILQKNFLFKQKEIPRKSVSFKKQMFIDLSDDRKNLPQNMIKIEQYKKSDKIRGDGFVQLESFDLDFSQIKKCYQNDLTVFNDFNDFLGFSSKNRKMTIKSQDVASNVPKDMKIQQTSTQKDEQIRQFLEIGNKIYKMQHPQIELKPHQPNQEQEKISHQNIQLSFHNVPVIQPLKIKQSIEVLQISGSKPQIKKDKKKKAKKKNEKKNIKKDEKKDEKKSSRNVSLPNDKQGKKRIKKQIMTVITIQDSPIKIDDENIKIKTNIFDKISIIPMQEQQKQTKQDIQQQKFNKEKNIKDLKRSRSEASHHNNKQTILQKRKRQKKEKQNQKKRQKEEKKKKTQQDKKKKRQQQKNQKQARKQKQLQEERRRKQQQQKQKREQQKKRIDNQKKQEKNRKIRAYHQKRNDEKRQKKLEQKRVLQEQKQRKQEQSKIQQSLISKEDKQYKQSINIKTKSTREPKKKNPPKKKRNQSSSIDTDKSKNSKNKKNQIKKGNVKNKNKTNSLVPQNDSSLASSVSSLRSSSGDSLESFNSNSDNISIASSLSSSLSIISNNSLNTTRGIGQRKAKNKVKIQEQPPQTFLDQNKAINELISLVQSLIGHNPLVAFNLISKKDTQLIVFAEMNTQGLLLQSQNGNYKQIKIQTLTTTRNDLIQAFDKQQSKVAKKGKFWTFKNSENFAFYSTKKSSTPTILRITIIF